MRDLWSRDGPAGLPRGRWGLRWTAVFYLALMILLPLAAVLATGMELGPVALVSALAGPVAASAIRLTLILAAVTTAVNTVMGTFTA